MGEHVIKLPDVGEGVAEAELVEWHVKIGDLVREDTVLAAVMTDKATVEIPSPVEGEILWLGASVGDQVAVGGMPKLDEVVFFHRPSRTLFVWDLCFHIAQSEHLPTRLFMRLNGAYGRFGPSRIARSMMRDRAAVRASVERMLAWAPERIVVAHGDVVERGGRDALQGAFERVL